MYSKSCAAMALVFSCAVSQAALAQAIAKPPSGPVAPATQAAAPTGTLNAQFAALQAQAGAAEPGQSERERVGGPAAVTPVQSVAKPLATPATPATVAPTGVALARRVVEAASAYESFMRHAAAIPGAFSDAGAVVGALNTGAAYQAQQLEEGTVAYTAIVALQDPMFVQGVRDSAGEGAAQTDFAKRLLAEPAAVAAVPGARSAAALASAALRRHGEALQSAGLATKQAAYDVQHQPWSTAFVADADARLAHAKQLSLIRFTPTADDTAQVLKSAVALRRTEAGAATDAPVSPVAARGLALAALAVLGQAGEDMADALAPLLVDPANADCVKMAKLNLFQCLSVAGPHYEDVFCLGQHAMLETARCVIAAAGPAAAPVATPTQSKILLAQSVIVPIAAGGAGSGTK